MTSILEDFIIIKDLNLKIENKKIFKAGFIGNSFNNLLSLGGLSGMKIRMDLVKGLEDAIQYIVAVPFSQITGLFLLIPLLVFESDPLKFPYRGLL